MAPRRRRPPQDGAKRPRRSQQEAPKQQPPKIKFVDAHIRVGLEDNLVRIPLPDWQVLLLYWMLNQEDVILRGRYDKKETNIVLRGNANGTLTVREPNPQIKIPLFRVVRAIEERASYLEQIGFSRSGDDESS